MLVKTVLQVLETRHCHTEVSPSENVQEFFGKWLPKYVPPEYARN